MDRVDTDRVLTADEADAAFQDKTIEVVAHAEEAVVEKTARVTGEVTVGLEQNTREETVGGTVRSTHVDDREQVDGGSTMDDEAHFKNTYANSGSTYDQMRPAYDYGRTASSQATARATSRPTRTPCARTTTTTIGQKAGNAWDDVKDAVRHGWESTKRAVS